MKILASDLDGTLVVNNKISKEDIEAIHKLKENGGKFVISTGRTPNGVKNLIDNYPLEYDYLSLCNGGLIIDKNDNIVWDKWIPNKVYKSILEDYYNNEDVIISCDNSKEIRVVWKNETKTEETLGYLSIPFKRIEREEMEKKTDDYRMLSLFTFSNDYEWAEKAKNEIIDKYGEYVEAYRNQFFIDVVPKGCSKGNALLKILELEGEDKENLYTIGDSFNDLSMLKITPNGYTFNRVEDELKKHVNNLTDNVYELIDIMLK